MNKIIPIILAVVLLSTPVSTLHAAEQSDVKITENVGYTDELVLTLGEEEPLKVNSLKLQEVVAQPKVVVEEKLTVKQVAEKIITENFGAGHFKAFDTIVTRESNWNPQAINKSSGACGLGQALPCSKLKDHSIQGQLEWMVSYIKSRYGTPKNALHFWNRNHWY